MWLKQLLVGALLSAGVAQAQASFPGIGREAKPAEIKAWDIDVRADFKGLPKGSGSVAKGADIWDGKCASCHGVFGESNQVFTPLVGGISAQDIAKGRVAGLIDGKQPYRTTLMKASQVSTLWDYINRAMPWNAPKSLSTDEVYAVTAYMLHMGEILPADFVMSDANIKEVQARMPNRNGKTDAHGLWSVKGTPDVRNTACMTGCGSGKVTSSLPDYARDAHGNLVEQHRALGPYRGVDTTKPPSAVAIPAVLALASMSSLASTSASTQNSPNAVVMKVSEAKPADAKRIDVKPLLSKYTCTACHGMNNTIVGPSFAEIAKKHQAKAGSVDYLAGKIKQGGQGAWGAIPMPAQALPVSDAKLIAQWLVHGGK